ncbi:MAG: nucleoside deaminase [Myxococcota bacterium]
MGFALEQARLGFELEEVPVGAVMVFEDAVIAAAHNRRESEQDPLGHAELIVIREAASRLGRWRLWGCTLVVTLEPCPMCAGAIVNARVDGLVFGANDPRAGAAGSVMNLVDHDALNHRPWTLAGVRAATAADLLRDFFRRRRT